MCYNWRRGTDWCSAEIPLYHTVAHFVNRQIEQIFIPNPPEIVHRQIAQKFY
jgi:hypothetical protein